MEIWKEINKIISFIVVCKILRYKFDKDVQDLYTENYKVLLRKVKDLNKERFFHGLGDFILSRKQLSTSPVKFNAVPVEIPAIFLEIYLTS